ncbi:MAG: co-chaperone GroES, partial [Planctomycetota bacterium]
KGQEVLFTSYAGTEVKVGNKDYLIMDESDILAIVE